MKNIALLLLVTVALAGCREEVSREATGPATIITGPQACYKSGFCYKCGLDWHGEFSCGFRMSSMCTGTRTATTVRTPVRIMYDDGTFEDTVAVQTSESGMCR